MSDLKIDPEVVKLAASQEEVERLSAQIQYFNRRVVLLRSAVIELTSKLSRIEGVFEQNEIDLDTFLADNLADDPADTESD